MMFFIEIKLECYHLENDYFVELKIDLLKKL